MELRLLALGLSIPENLARALCVHQLVLALPRAEACPFEANCSNCSCGFLTAAGVEDIAREVGKLRLPVIEWFATRDLSANGSQLGLCSCSGFIGGWFTLKVCKR
jgi:hypothetical protein